MAKRKKEMGESLCVSYWVVGGGVWEGAVKVELDSGKWI